MRVVGVDTPQACHNIRAIAAAALTTPTSFGRNGDSHVACQPLATGLRASRHPN